MTDHIAFRPLARSDFLSLATWLQQEHVQRWWQDHDTSPEHLEAKYGPRVDGIGPRVFVVLVDDAPSGIAQWCPSREYAAWPTRFGLEDSVAIDYLIGDTTLVGRGIGTTMIGRFVALVGEQAPLCMDVVADPLAANTASCRVLEKNGFESIFEGSLEDGWPISRLYRKHVTSSLAPTERSASSSQRSGR